MPDAKAIEAFRTPPKGRNMLGKNIMQIMRHSPSIVIMKNKSYPRRAYLKKSPPPLGQESKIEGTEITHTQAALIFMVVNKLLIYQTKPPMYVSCALPKEGTTNTVDGMDHPFREIVKRHEIESHG